MSPRVPSGESGYLRVDGEVHLVLRRTQDGSQVVLRAPDGGEYEISAADYRLAKAEGRITNDPDEPTGHRLASPKEIRKQQFRLAVLRIADAERTEGKTWQEIVPILERLPKTHPEFAGLEIPTVRQIQNWRKQRETRGDLALRPQTHKCGDRSKRWDDEFEDVVLDVVERHYLTSDRATIADIVETANEDYEKKYGRAPERNHGRKVVETIIESISHDDRVRARLGLRESRKYRLKAKFHIAVQSPFDRIEIDCTTADAFIADDDRRCVGRPTICTGVDCATGMIVGQAVTLEAPSSSLVARVLRELMTPKDQAFFDHFGIKHPFFDAYCRPLVVVWDQGSENKGGIIERILEIGRIHASPCLPGHPERKPFVERMNSEINRFVRLLPGASKSDLLPGLERIDKGEAEALLTLEEFECALQRWRYDHHHLKIRRAVVSALRQAESPRDAFHRLTEGRRLLLPLPPTDDEIREMFMLPGGKRRLNHYGIDFKGLRYMSSAVLRLLSEVGAGTNDVEIHYNPADARTILVRHPRTGVDEVALCKEPDMPAVDFAYIERVHKRLNLSADQPVSKLAIVEDVVRSAVGEGDGKTRSMGAARKHAEINKRRAKSIVEKSRKDPQLQPVAPHESLSAPIPSSQASTFSISAAPMTVRKRHPNASS